METIRKTGVVAFGVAIALSLALLGLPQSAAATCLTPIGDDGQLQPSECPNRTQPEDRPVSIQPVQPVASKTVSATGSVSGTAETTVATAQTTPHSVAENQSPTELASPQSEAIATRNHGSLLRPVVNTLKALAKAAADLL